MVIAVVTSVLSAALQMRCKWGSNSPGLASLDTDLQRVVGAWDGLPRHIRETILTLAGFVEPPARQRLQDFAALSTL